MNILIYFLAFLGMLVVAALILYAMCVLKRTWNNNAIKILSWPLRRYLKRYELIEVRATKDWYHIEHRDMAQEMSMTAQIRRAKELYDSKVK